jgi:Ribosomal protein L7/L12 C-terminal domain
MKKTSGTYGTGDDGHLSEEVVMGSAVEGSFELVLQSYLPEEKIRVIAAVSHVTGLAMNEAKELVERAPVVVRARLARAEAETLKANLEGGFWPAMGSNFARLPGGERCCTATFRECGASEGPSQEPA